jgi:hypothetical protein
MRNAAACDCRAQRLRHMFLHRDLAEMAGPVRPGERCSIL